MKVNDAYFSNGAFLVVTTGARYEYIPGELKIYQGLRTDVNDKRHIATVAIEGNPKFEKVEANNDHVLLWSEKLNIGVYGDSTCILAPKENLSISFKGNFKPDYEGHYKGELLLIDALGGMEIYPQRYEAGYEVKKIELGKNDWVAEYVLSANERVMIAAFPGKEFDWDASFKSNVIINSGGFGSKTPFEIGVLPSDDLLRQWSDFFDITVLFYNSIYKNGKGGGPYEIANAPEFRRVISTCHSHGMKVGAYTSLFYFYRAFKTTEPYYEQILALKNTYNIDGVYIDGLLFDQDPFYIDDKITNWEAIRRLRQLFGQDGVIVYHGTSLGSPVATAPNVDCYCTITLNGEGVKFKDANDPYVRYQVRKYGISNTVGSWITYSTPKVLTPRQIIDAHIKMNGRMWYSEYDLTMVNPKDFLYYRTQLAQLRKSHSLH
jgi:hypothetical protein